MKIASNKIKNAWLKDDSNSDFELLISSVEICKRATESTRQKGVNLMW